MYTSYYIILYHYHIKRNNIHISFNHDTVMLFKPSPPTKSFPAKSPRVELSGRLPIKLYGHENSHPLELRVCLSQTL